MLQSSDGIYISQKKYASDVLKRFKMEEATLSTIQLFHVTKIFKDENCVKLDATLFKKLVESLMYLTTTQPELKFVVNLVSRHMGQPTELHLHANKKVLRYLIGTKNLNIFCKKGGNEELVAFTDSDYAGDFEDILQEGSE